MTAERIPLCEEDQKRHSSTPAGPAFANLTGKIFTRSENVQTKPGNFTMTDEAKALVERLRKTGLQSLAEAADLIETQAREIERLREALQWYEKQANGCRKITREGDDARYALDKDGGERARTALGENHD